MTELEAVQIEVQINAMPNEVAAPIRFPDDEVHASYVSGKGQPCSLLVAVQAAPDPDGALLLFLASTYRAAADLGGWNRSLECAIGVPGRPRQVNGSA